MQEILDTGFYTPTLTNVTNIGDSTAVECMWFRTGCMVTVSGSAAIDPTAAAPTATELGISLPIPSSLTLARQLAGVAACSAVQQSGRLEADATNDRAALLFSAVDTANRTWNFQFTYTVRQ